MSQEQLLRAVVIGLFAVTFPIGVYHRVKSLATREPLDRSQEGVFILATLRPVGMVMWFAVFAWIINPQWMAWSSLSLPSWIRWVGAGVLVAACGLMVWTFRSLGRNLTDTVVTRQVHSLVTHGPYRWVRHPLYDTAALLTIAMSLIAANWFVVISGALVLSLLIVRTRTEESNLIARFGDGYRDYMERTGRFFPR